MIYLIIIVFVIALILLFGLSFGRRLIVISSQDLSVLIMVSVGIVVLALVGLLISIIPLARQPVAAGVLVVAVVLSLLLIGKNHFDWAKTLIVNARIPILLWTVVSLLMMSATFLTVKKPDVLFDGPYVFKVWNLPVQIQAAVGNYPADNALPAVITEYLVRGVPFAQERPVMPGQEVSNRPILMGLAAVPIRAAFSTVEAYSAPLEKFSYVGTDWPDTMGLISDHGFRLFLSVAIVLNASLLLGFNALLRKLKVPYPFWVTVTFFVLSPYPLLHTIFTWPKNLAAFFILTSALALLSKNVRLAGVAMGLAYLAHPFALVFAFVSTLYLFVIDLQARKRTIVQPSILFGVSLVAVVVPWFIWTKVWLEIPSDLIAQNFSIDTTVVDFVWVRVYNLYNLLAPTFLGDFPFNMEMLLQKYFISLAAPVGILLYLFFPHAFVCNFKSDFGKALIILLIVPGIILVGVFSKPAVPLLMGWQAVWPVIVAMVLSLRIDRRIIIGLVGSQFVINVAFLMFWGLNAIELG